jgi:hypothetical protein
MHFLCQSIMIAAGHGESHAQDCQFCQLPGRHGANRLLCKFGKPMNSEHSKRAGLKQNVIHQLKDLTKIFLYLAFFFCAIATYRMLLLNELHLSYFDYGTALINALVVAKVILLGATRTLAGSTKPRLYSFQLFIRRFCLACWYSPFTLLRRRLNDCCTEKDWLEHSARCASTTCSRAV